MSNRGIQILIKKKCLCNTSKLACPKKKNCRIPAKAISGIMGGGNEDETFAEAKNSNLFLNTWTKENTITRSKFFPRNSKNIQWNHEYT